ncbi:LysM peptidoglycan-binding domain-containing protein [Fulvivirgaceae bacterium BMA10]|uniref:LysM peptidoglycan-binding domain-containing protein n=1 Tax=Splendidivirga corallicola TaxID=3051826 RepID=A0ABT8KN30_9BACT|nr:LysM peptidoglycan-binding domain-containing protein [Fulvivirgaceae bacterium BMA10]
MKNVLISFFVLLSGMAFSQGPRVPANMEFAGIKLKITEGARREIQKDVDMLTRSQKYLNIKLDRAKLYFPIIERVFREERLPDDFKYLVLQESALISHAVSSANAVGFWQFKKGTGLEMGLRIDGTVDERMNIVSSSRAAAGYIKKNNFLYFNNWLHSLQAYQMGPGGALKAVDKSKAGATKMTISKQTYWYVKKYLAHKVAFEYALRNYGGKGTMLAEYTKGTNRNLRSIANEFSLSEDELKSYNKWLKRGRIPDDRQYTVVFPVENNADRKLMTLVNNRSGSKSQKTVVSGKTTNAKLSNEGSEFPIVKTNSRSSSSQISIINSLPGTIAADNTKVRTLAKKAGISEDDFRSYNDMGLTDEIIAGKAYYFKKKRNKAKIHYYAARPGESLWSISQKFGIRLKKLMQKNRMKNANELKAGQVLWLRFIRPANEPIEYIDIPGKEPALLVKENRPIDTPKAETKKESVSGSTKPEVKTYTYRIEGDDEVNETPVNSQKSEAQNTTTSTPTYRVEKNTNNQNVIERKSPEPDPDEFVVTDEVKFINEDKAIAKNGTDKNTHTVEQGETLYSLSKQYDVTIDELRKWNNIGKNEGIKYGQQLRVGFLNKKPEIQAFNTALKSDIIEHQVKQGETMYKIAQQYGITVQKIMELNNKKDYDLSIGEKIKVQKAD